MDRSREHTVAFTGHRRYDGECDDALRAVVRELYGRGFRVFWSGMALGFDLAAAEAVLALARGTGPDCGSAAPFLSPGRRIVFRRRIASDICGFSIGRTRWRRSLRVMNRVVTCAATSLWWSGRPPVVAWFDGGKGGTRYTWDYARRCKAERINLWCDGQQELF